MLGGISLSAEGGAQAVGAVDVRSTSLHFGRAFEWPFWIDRRVLGIELFVVPICRPFIQISCQVMDSVRALALVTIPDRRNRVGTFLQTKNGVGWGRSVVAPRVLSAVGPARRLFPLCLRRQPFSHPEAIA